MTVHREMITLQKKVCRALDEVHQVELCLSQMKDVEISTDVLLSVNMMWSSLASLEEACQRILDSKPSIKKIENDIPF